MPFTHVFEILNDNLSMHQGFLIDAKKMKDSFSKKRIENFQRKIAELKLAIKILKESK